jgi:hypothetical protein
MLTGVRLLIKPAGVTSVPADLRFQTVTQEETFAECLGQTDFAFKTGAISLTCLKPGHQDELAAANQRDSVKPQAPLLARMTAANLYPAHYESLGKQSWARCGVVH